MALVNNSEVQTQLSSLVQDALRLETQLQNARGAKEVPSPKFEEDKSDMATVLPLERAQDRVGGLQDFQNWLREELRAQEERLRTGLVSDLGSLLRHSTLKDAPSVTRPLSPDTSPARLICVDSDTEEKDLKIPGMVETTTPRSRKSYRFAGPDDSEIMAAQSRRGTTRGPGLNSSEAETGMCPVVPEEKPTLTNLKSQRSMKLKEHHPLQDLSDLTGITWLREWFRRHFVENTCFGYIIIAFIVANSLTMGIQADWMVTHIGEDAPMVFDIFENMFAVVFTCELVMRIFVYNVNFFRMADWKWNIFDTLVVGLQLFDIITTLTIQAGSNNQAGANFNFMRLVRLMRLLRILRLMRVLRFVQELRSMVMSIAASLRSLMWTIVLLAFLMYGVGVCLTQMVADRGLEDPLIMQRTPEIKLFYGSLVEALVSLFAGITGGIDWNDLLEPLETEIGPWLAALFVLYIAFAVLAMMNVVTGIFVESALQSTRADEEKEVRQQLQELFRHVDAGHDGCISWEEFRQHLENPDMMRCFESLGFDISEAYGLFNLLDTDQSGNIECEELLEGCLRLRGPANAIDVATLQYSSKRVFEWWRGNMDCVQDSLSCILEMLEKAAASKDPVKTQHIKQATEKLVKCKDGQGNDTRIFETWKKFRTQETKPASRRNSENPGPGPE
ncbi:unnamed protein product [Effrenium voratum]|nr:unnamed protein product [Effrenium voratum]|mmetsp:Transcript_29731/g.70670  ORF Transcript_29731/g.70670 Transcript_29731/m.70670 type:complete len:673 (-) Transcript_29731:174-2192(-)|eukprot:CAMPEP_0181425388 /NCGR_PEP_ID=MMETSP1110-20121109/15132_1 /TAXON_ID=174948 /ORGANISM="Symbiodinium sp., Strain CCMP421" /LENGTH=672 /DNA_ID=CAMNT_0023548571 /DNA_START=57 /DNA_END=2075 /DNA_ORIENTATION=+